MCSFVLSNTDLTSPIYPTSSILSLETQNFGFWSQPANVSRNACTRSCFTCDGFRILRVRIECIPQSIRVLFRARPNNHKSESYASIRIDSWIGDVSMRISRGNILKALGDVAEVYNDKGTAET
jgi:hypothetical protein